MTTNVCDAINQPLSVGDRVAFMNEVAHDGYTVKSMSAGIVARFTPKMVSLTTSNGNVLRCADKIVKVYTQP